MPFLNFNSAKPGLKLVITIMTVITFGMIISFVGFLLSRIFFCLDVPEANEILYGNHDVLSNAQIKYYQAVNTLAFFVVPGFFLVWLFSTPEKRYVSLVVPSNKSTSYIAPIIILISIPFINYLIKYNSNLTFPSFLEGTELYLKDLNDKISSNSMSLLKASNIWALISNIFIVSLLPAVGEELIFRGIIQKVFYNISRNKHMAIIFGAIIFGAVHAQFFSFLPRFVLGVFFGYLLIWSGSIWLPILAHFTYNTIVVVFYYLYEKGSLTTAPSEWGLNILNGSLVWISIILVSGGIFMLYKSTRQKT